MISDKVDFEILGNEIQTVEVELDPNEKVIAEAGTMIYFDEGITFESKTGDGAEVNQGFFEKMLDVSKRALTGKSIFLTHFTNTSHSKKRVAFSSFYPGRVLAIDLKQVSGSLLHQKDAFLAAASGTKVGFAFKSKLGEGTFGKDGYVLQKLEGDGMIFLHIGGTPIEKELKGETIQVDAGCVAGFSGELDYSIGKADNLKSIVFKGDKFFLATLSGFGKVFLQSLPISRLIDRIMSGAYASGKNSIKIR